MSEDKKPKIDLKSRLGKKTVSAPGGPAVPPPVGIPKPVGIPAPLFGQPEKKAPKIDASDPYASLEAGDAPVRAEPQAIKIEMSEEVVQAQKKGRVFLVVAGVVGALIGGLVGFTSGSSSEQKKGAEIAVKGARELTGEVEKALGAADEMAATFKEAAKKLADNQFPEAEVTKLGELNIPFDGSNLAGRNIGRFRPELINMLVTFSGRCAEANEQKDKIRSLLSLSKKGIQEFLDQKKAPKVRWGVIVSSGPGGPWAAMQPLPEPFLVAGEKTKDKDGKEVDYKWPVDFKIPVGGKPTELKRYDSGDATSTKLVPVNPETEGAVCPSDTLVRLAREVRGMEEVFRGDPTPGAEKQGILELGKQLGEKLKAVGAPGG